MNYQWAGYLLIAAIPGVINLIVATQELRQKCRALVFFRFWQSPVIYFWALPQVLLPSLLFWYMSKLEPTVPIKLAALPGLLSEAVALGVGFVAVLNSTTEIGSFSLKLKWVYDFCVDLAYGRIASQQTRRAAKFWYQVKSDLERHPPEKIELGLDYLEAYFEVDISLNQQKNADYLSQIKTIRQAPAQDEKADLIDNLLKDVRTADLEITLWQFGFSKERTQELLRP